MKTEQICESTSGFSPYEQTKSRRADSAADRGKKAEELFSAFQADQQAAGLGVIAAQAPGGADADILAFELLFD